MNEKNSDRDPIDRDITDRDTRDVHWMTVALEFAAQAAKLSEVPVGAVLVRGDQLLGTGYNQPISAQDASAHAEIMALRDAGSKAGNYRLPETTMYVTLEPCMMCAGALVHARVKRLVFGANENKAGAVCSHDLLGNPWLNHQIEVHSGVLAEQCGAILSEFFAARRELIKNSSNDII